MFIEVLFLPCSVNLGRPVTGEMGDLGGSFLEKMKTRVSGCLHPHTEDMVTIRIKGTQAINISDPLSDEHIGLLWNPAIL